MRGGDTIRSVEVAIVDEHGIVDARTRARVLAASLGFATTDQYKLATAVSELSRNIFRYAGKGKVSFGPVSSPRPGMFIVARDDGPGIPDIEQVLSESYVSKTGLGRGLQGCRRIMDEFQIDSTPGRGTTVTLRKFLA
jgi:serine/threonine-protein kinase RsbT